MNLDAKIYVAGHRGLVGSAIVRNLESKGYKNIIYRTHKELDLTKNEIKIFSCLLENKGSIVSREALMEYLWKSDYFVDDSTLSVNVTRLRKKLDGLGIQNVIETRRGLGYIIE